MDNTPWYALGVSQGFKWSLQDTHAHSGIDLATDVGRPITAPFDGIQVSEGTEAWGGQENELVLNQQGQPEVLSWLHMSEELPIAPGSPIHAGDLLGFSGTPPPQFGNGPHIHFEETAGRLPPYMSNYNPWYPTAASFPINPTPTLIQLKATGGGGKIGGLFAGGGGTAPGYSSQLGYTSAYAAGIGNPLDGVAQAIDNFGNTIDADVTAAEKAVVDGLKRAGVFIIGLVLFGIGLYILFHPEIQSAEQAARGLIHTPGDFIHAIAGNKGAAPGGRGKKHGRTRSGGAAAAASKAAAPEAAEAAPAAGAAGVVDAVPAAAVAAV